MAARRLPECSFPRDQTALRRYTARSLPIMSASNIQPGPELQWRRLRGYAFDPGLSQQFATAAMNEIVFRIPWEALEAGPRGEYVEVIDHDPASEAFYEPVDLNEGRLVGADGLDPDEGNPQFHQQFVYAVAMTTIRNFGKALGRRLEGDLDQVYRPMIEGMGITGRHTRDVTFPAGRIAVIQDRTSPGDRNSLRCAAERSTSPFATGPSHLPSPEAATAACPDRSGAFANLLGPPASEKGAVPPYRSGQRPARPSPKRSRP